MMNKNEIITNLNRAHSSFWNIAIHSSSVNASVNGKWSVAQNVDHINIALHRLNNYLLLPKSSIQVNFGLSGRVSISNDMLFKKYQIALANGAKATAPFIPALIQKDNMTELVEKGKYLLESLILNLEFWEEEEFEMYNCPHPVLGNTTTREILYFTIFHVQHHNEIIKKFGYEF